MYKLIFLPLLLVTVCGTAQIKISGKVTNAKRKALEAISLSIVGSYDGATTDSAGNFSFTTSEKGEQILKATGSG